MKSIFKTEIEEKIKEFREIKSIDTLATVLEIDKYSLIYYAYKMTDKEKYVIFEIEKRSGKKRQIQAPIKPLKLIQKKIYQLILPEYNPKHCVHGYVKDRSVLTNAKLHVRKPFLLNIDLADFFPSINVKRVFGLFKSSKFGFPKKVSAYLAQLCTYSGFLPQGAPTSPILANMIAYSLDKKMMAIAKQNRFNYTRYADDIALSTAEPKVGNLLADDQSHLRREILSTITDCGFTLNKGKTRFSSRYNHREVTGIIVNEKLNIRRKYYRQIRAMLHAWYKYGYTSAEKEFLKEYDKRNRTNEENEGPRFHKVVKGKIDWLQMVRGRDKIYQKLRGKYIYLRDRDKAEIEKERRTIANHEKTRKMYNSSDFFENSVFVIENSIKQGTCFYLKDIGFITCAHVVGDIEKRIENKGYEIFKGTKSIEKHKAEVITANYDYDFAVLKADSFDRSNIIVLDMCPKDCSLENGQEVTICGYPSFAVGREIRVEKRKIVSKRVRFSIDLIELDGGIYEGGSGGPVLNEQCQVLGICVVGSNTEGAIFDTDAHCFLPLPSIITILEEIKKAHPTGGQTN